MSNVLGDSVIYVHYDVCEEVSLRSDQKNWFTLLYRSMVLKFDQIIEDIDVVAHFCAIASSSFT